MGVKVKHSNRFRVAPGDKVKLSTGASIVGMF
jgi:hypothetical protein